MEFVIDLFIFLFVSDGFMAKFRVIKLNSYLPLVKKGCF